MAETMPSTHSVWLRSRSVSSMRRMNTPWLRRANSQLYSAVRAPPTWKYPVGDGAKRTRTAAAISEGYRDGRPASPEQPLGDHHPLHLVGALVDLGDLGVPE